MINITYIISTKNRLPFLKILNKHIFSNLNDDEEIVIVDGDSTDGSKEFLSQLYNQRIIQSFISEKDRNQAHGWNKALLMARGTIIKKIIDDDVFDLEAIRKCARWMLEHQEMDFCISDCLQTTLIEPITITSASRKAQYLAWKDNKTKSFTYSDVYLLIRKSSLSEFGLFDTQFRMLDWEYSLRCSYLKAKIAYYTGNMALCVNTPGNITSTTSPETLSYEGEIGKLKYEYAGDGAEISLYSKFKIFIGKTLDKINQQKQQLPVHHSVKQREEIYESLYCQLSKKNSELEFSIIH